MKLRWPFFEFLKRKLPPLPPEPVEPDRRYKGYLEVGEIIYDVQETQTLFPYIKLKMPE
jgi:hypothetical protein